MLIQKILLSLTIIIVRCIPPINELQGFGTDMNIRIFRQVVAQNQLSLRNYIQPNTLIKISPNKTIVLKQIITIKQTNDIIIQGPGTLVGCGIYIQNSTNIIIHNLRILNASIYGILIYYSHNVVINSLTIIDASRDSIDKGKCIDITQNSSNVTVSNTILGYSHFSQVDKYKGMLIANFLSSAVTNISIHHNIFYQNYQRSPQISTPGLFDFKNNIIYGFTVYGSRIRQQAYGNFQSNFYIGGKKDPLVFIDQSAKLSYARNNHWKFNYSTWVQIQDYGNHKYIVPKVTEYNYQVLLQKIQKWGCQPESYIQRQIKQTIAKESQSGK